MIPMPIIIIPLPIASLIAGLIGGYAAEKFVHNIEPKIDRALKSRARKRKEKKEQENVVYMHEVSTPPF